MVFCRGEYVVVLLKKKIENHCTSIYDCNPGVFSDMSNVRSAKGDRNLGEEDKMLLNLCHL